MIFDLSRTTEFPDPRFGHPSGLYAVGGDLSPERLIKAYPRGIFPWYAFRDDQIQWWAPHRRFVIFADEIHISHSMRNLMNKKTLTCSINEDFEGVINGCGMVDGRMMEENAWLGPELTETWLELNRRGHAKSVEVWDEDDYLVGGLYGFVSGGCFIGDSMFSLVPSASKMALIHLARHMKEQGGIFIDCQLKTDHLESMGARFIPYDEYLEATLNSKPIEW
ncbi:MAG: leucyl/phenylalanyl-tRNA--protein transferase [Bacteroidales bacterium]|nr:leucyl/phenylalanyl-tRNA--protein transferase [Bacteroidales bacterium]